MKTVVEPLAKFRGFTMIELMVTLAIIAIVAGLAAPSLTGFVIRAKMSGIGNDFAASIQRARNEAVTKNSCVTMCMSETTTATGSGSSGPICSDSGQDWQVGWIVFLNPSCDTTLTYPSVDADLILTREPTQGTYRLNAQGSQKKVTFNSRGSPGIGGGDRFALSDESSSANTDKYGFQICLDAVGRTRNIPSSANSCSTY